jgi:hypothetical protein
MDTPTQYTGPVGWETLVNHDPMSNIQIPRTKETNERYQKHREYLLAENITLEDYVKLNSLDKSDTIFVENDFPYWLEDGIGHYLYWMLPEVTLGVDEVRKLMPAGALIWENTDIRKSVKLPHYHVFIKHF